MPNNQIFPLAETIVATQTITTNGTSSAVVLPRAQSYRLIAEINTVSGTSPTLQIIMATSTDSTVYTEVLSLTQMTTTGLGRMACFRPYLGVGDAATDQQVGLLGTTDLASSSVVTHGPINPQYIKFRWIVTGTSPSFSTTIKLIAEPFGGYGVM